MGEGNEKKKTCPVICPRVVRTPGLGGNKAVVEEAGPDADAAVADEELPAALDAGRRVYHKVARFCVRVCKGARLSCCACFRYQSVSERKRKKTHSSRPTT